jgi:uncharacterized protein YndB with AHSA1/START domain
MGKVNLDPLPVIHGSFALPLDLGVPPGRVYAAYSDPAQRSRWFRIPSEPGQSRYELDFRVGGHETARGVFAPSGTDEERIEYRSAFCEIVASQRIVFTYEVLLNDLRRWVSLVTIELSPSDGSNGGTHLRHTEQYAFLAYTGDGQQDVAHLKGGTRLQLNGLMATVASVVEC